MKTKTEMKVLTLICALLLFFSVPTYANSSELIGGIFYTSLELPSLNEAIDNYNDEIEEIEQEGVSATEMDEIDDAIGYFGGTKLDLNDGISLSGTFETFSESTATEIDYSENNDTIEVGLEIGLSVSGLVATLNSELNEYISLVGGGGYYFGEVSMSGSATSTGDYSDYFVLEETSVSTELNGFGFKAGGYFSYPVNYQLAINAAVHYRFLELETGANSLTNATALDANGIELRFGVAFGV